MQEACKSLAFGETARSVACWIGNNGKDRFIAGLLEDTVHHRNFCSRGMSEAKLVPYPTSISSCKCGRVPVDTYGTWLCKYLFVSLQTSPQLSHFSKV